MPETFSRPQGPRAFTPTQVCLYRCKPHRRDGGHEHRTHAALAERIAALIGARVGADVQAGCPPPPDTYFVPDDTVTSLEEAQRIGICSRAQLFGGVVPWRFAATKVITHPLFDAASAAPTGWSPAFGEQVRSVVLPGYSAFAIGDAQRAGLALLADGRVRLKKADGIGGAGQVVVADEASLIAALRVFDEEDVWSEGVVLERNLNEVVTRSVGQVQVGAMLASYCGLQRLTRDRHGHEIYGGSTLQVVRGDYDAMSKLDHEDASLLAVQQARTYQQAAFGCFRGMFASRCNYDVAQGVDDAGKRWSGVLEQSWRIGGASGAELAALQAFVADPALERVSASTCEIHGEGADIPADAAVYFQGVDERIGPIVKYSRIEQPASSRP